MTGTVYQQFVKDNYNNVGGSTPQEKMKIIAQEWRKLKTGGMNSHVGPDVMIDRVKILIADLENVPNQIDEINRKYRGTPRNRDRWLKNLEENIRNLPTRGKLQEGVTHTNHRLIAGLDHYSDLRQNTLGLFT